MVSKRLKRVVQIALMFFSCWFGEWSYVVAAVRSVADWLVGGSAFPRLASYTPYYGLSWRVAFYRGGIGVEDLLNGIGLLLIPSLLWIFIEFWKGKA